MSSQNLKEKKGKIIRKQINRSVQWDLNFMTWIALYFCFLPSFLSARAKWEIEKLLSKD